MTSDGDRKVDDDPIDVDALLADAWEPRDWCGSCQRARSDPYTSQRFALMRMIPHALDQLSSGRIASDLPTGEAAALAELALVGLRRCLIRDFGHDQVESATTEQIDRMVAGALDQMPALRDRLAAHLIRGASRRDRRSERVIKKLKEAGLFEYGAPVDGIISVD